MADKKDYYGILGVQRTASADEIKSAYRKLAIKYHPDKNDGSKASEDKFKEISEAYDILSDKDKKNKYDQYGHQGLNYGFNPNTFFDIERKFRQAQQEIQKHSAKKEHDAKYLNNPLTTGEDIRITLKLSDIEMIRGAKKTLKISKKIVCIHCKGSGSHNNNMSGNYYVCPDCDGMGRVRKISSTILGEMTTDKRCERCLGIGSLIYEKCLFCSGSGRIDGHDSISIDTPAHISARTQLKAATRGNAGIRGGYAGDLLIVVERE